jgi:hypothetical protein
LQNKGHLRPSVESVDLEDLPSVRGLKALRVDVDLEAAALAQRLDQVALG